MPTGLQQLFTQVSESTSHVLKKVEPYEHPLLTLLTKELKTQQEMLSSILTVFDESDGKPSLDSFRQQCSTVYHANELAMSFSDSWLRAVDWMKLPSRTVASDVGPEMKQMKQLLGTAAGDIQELYGKDAVKYVIPTFYLPA